MLVAVSAISSMAAYVNQFVDNFTVDDLYSCSVIDNEARTVSLDFINSDKCTGLTSWTVPSTVTRMVWNNQSNEYDPVQYTVVQLSENHYYSFVKLKTLTIPATLQTIGSHFFGEMVNIEEITFEKANVPLEICEDAFIPNSDAFVPTLKILNLNRSIIGLEASDYSLMPKLNGIETINIGEGVEEFGSNMFKGIESVNRVNIADWNKWWNDVKLGNVFSNPYRNGSDVYVGGMRHTTIELEGMTEIPDYKLAGFQYEGELVLPSTLKRIGAAAFWQASNLYYVLFNEGLEEIGDEAFYGCETLEFDSFPTTLKSIGASAFYDCDMLKSIVLPEDLESVGEYAFFSMNSLEKAVLFSNLTELPEGLLADCQKLESLYLPQQLVTIGDKCFMGDYALEEVIFPATLEKIGNAAFLSLKLRNYNIGESENRDVQTLIFSGNPAYGEITLDELYINNWYNGVAGGLSKVTFPTALKEIGKGAFAGSQFITITANEGLEEIGDYAFWGCEKINELTLPTTLKSIGKRAFCDRTIEDYLIGNGSDSNVIYNRSIVKVEIPESVTFIGEDAFNHRVDEMVVNAKGTLPAGSCGYPSIIVIGKGITNIAAGAIDKKDKSWNDEYVNKLRLIRLENPTPPSVSAAFDFTNVEYDRITLVIPNGSKTAYERNPRWRTFNMVEESESDITVTVTGEYPLAEEIRMQSGLMPSRVSKMTVNGVLSDVDFRVIRENMLSLYDLNISAISNTELPAEAFLDASLLSNMVLPANLTTIGDKAFKGCKLLDMKKIPESVTTIGEESFSGCSRLSISSLPEGLESIGNAAFKNCTALKSFKMGGALSKLGAEVFRNCSLLEYVDLSDSKVEQLHLASFMNCGNLYTVELPESLNTINSSAFANSGLEIITLPKKLKSLGEDENYYSSDYYEHDGVFAATKLRTITIPEGVESIYTATFSDCPRLVSVNFPSTLTNIGKENGKVFENSLKLSGISCSAIDAPAATTATFSGIRASKCSLTVPTVSFRSYLDAPQWGMFSDLYNRIAVEIPSDLEVSSLPEEEYQEILEEEELTAEAEESAEETGEDDPAEMRRKLRAAAKADLVSGVHYTRLFNGATLGTSSNSKGVRLFINPLKGSKIKSIKHNGVDITSQLDGNSILLTSSTGTLQIISDNSGVEIIDSNDMTADVVCTAFDLTGRKVVVATRSEIASKLAAGIYVIKGAGISEKIVVR